MTTSKVHAIGADSQDAVRSRISLSQAPAGNDRRSQLKAEMDSLRGEQGKFKTERNKLFDELRRIQDSMNKKIKDQQAQRSKTGFKSVAEIDARIRWVRTRLRPDIAAPLTRA